jgi:hypothetical protein
VVMAQLAEAKAVLKEVGAVCLCVLCVVYMLCMLCMMCMLYVLCEGSAQGGKHPVI